MTVFKRGNVYWFHFIWNGRHVQMSTKQGNRRVAEQIEAAYRTKLAKNEVGLHEPKKVPTFGRAMAEFLRWSEQQHRSKQGTYRRYMVSSKALLRHFKDKPLDQVGVEEIEKFKQVRAQETKQSRSRKKREKPTNNKILRPATVNRELACLKAMFNYFVRADVVVRNPVSRVKFLNEDNEQMRVVSFEEQKLYLTASNETHQDVASLLFETGLRPEEVYRIKVENVHLEQGYLFNPYGKTKAARRKIPLNDIATEVIERRMRLALERGTSYLFPHRDDPSKPMVKAADAHRSALQRSGVLPFRLYDARHTWATRAVQSGVDLVTLAAMLGHSRIQMVLRYAHPTEDHQLEAMKKMQEWRTIRQTAEFEKVSSDAVQ